MKTMILVAALAVSFVLSGAGAAFACAGGGGVWYSFQHSWHHTGRSNCDLSGEIVDLHVWDVGVERASPVYRYAVDETIYQGAVFVAANDGKIYAFDDTDWSVMWQTGTYSGTKTTPLVLGNKLIFGSGSHVVALDVNTGEQQWDYVGSSQFGSNPSALPSTNTFYIGSDNGNVYAFNANTGSVIWTYSTGGAVRSTPAIESGAVYVGSDDGYVYALSATGGSLLWRTDVGGHVRSSPTVSYQNHVYFGVAKGDGTGALYSLNGNNGNVYWSRQLPSAVESSIALDSRTMTLYVGSNDGKVYALDADNGGSTVWEHQTGGAVTASPAITDAFILAGSHDGNVYGLSVSSGDVVWSYDTGEPLYSSFAIDSRKIFTSTESHTYVFGASQQPLGSPIGLLVLLASAVAVTVFYSAVRKFGPWKGGSRSRRA